MNFFVLSEDLVRRLPGPLTAAELIAAFREGRITEDTLVAEEEFGPALPVGQVLPLIRHLEHAPAQGAAALGVCPVCGGLVWKEGSRAHQGAVTMGLLLGIILLFPVMAIVASFAGRSDSDGMGSGGVRYEDSILLGAMLFPVVTLLMQRKWFRQCVKCHYRLMEG